MLKILALVCLMSTSAFALRVAGLKPWAGTAEYVSMGALDAQKEVFSGRADVALVRTPMKTPKGAGKALFYPVSVFPVVVAYNLPVDLTLTLEEVCDVFSGRILEWSSLRPDLPRLPIFSVVRLEPNSASWVLSQTCMGINARFKKIGMKSNWQAESTLKVKTLQEQQKAMGQTGTFSIFVPENLPEGLRTAKLKSWDLDLGPENLGYGYAANPEEEPFAGPFQPLPPVNEVQVYPLRGVVWAMVMQEQAYRNRSKEQARELRDLLYSLSITAGPGQALMPQEWVKVPRLYYNGKPFW
ncbi:substrate-binding domain-containing protein [Deinococcus roseus]|nr:substrate-binding domain-containing protein [Deinococcus roseus]